MFSPTLVELRKNFPDSKIDIFAYKKQFAEPFVNSYLINDIMVGSSLKSIFKLRKNRYHYCITAFPSNKWQFNLFAFLTGAKERITHSYDIGKFSTLSFLQNRKIKANEKIHDVDQNLNLLSLLGVNIPKNKKLYFDLQESNLKYARDFIKKMNLTNKVLVGIHPGSGPLKFKRVDDGFFIKKINSIKEKDKAVLIFGGPEEIDIKERLNSKIKDSIIVDTSLKNTASLISKCKYFITNDTGLMHMAATVNVPNITAFFKGTNYSRTRPYSKSAEVIILEENKLKYPFWSTKVTK